jgi:hypothetical protein
MGRVKALVVGECGLKGRPTADTRLTAGLRGHPEDAVPMMPPNIVCCTNHHRAVVIRTVARSTKHANEIGTSELH